MAAEAATGAAVEAATGAAVEATTGAAVQAATGTAVEVATGAASKVTVAAVCCGSVQGATEVAVVSGARAECFGRSGAGGTAAAEEESCASWSRRAAIPEQEGKSGAIMFSHKFIRTLLALASKVAVGELVAIEVLCIPPYDRSNTVRGRRGRRSIWTSLGARPVAALTELL